MPGRFRKQLKKSCLRQPGHETPEAAAEALLEYHRDVRAHGREPLSGLDVYECPRCGKFHFGMVRWLGRRVDSTPAHRFSAHAIQRLQERFGIEPTEQDLERIWQSIEVGEALMLPNDGHGGVEVYMAELMGRAMRLVVDPLSRVVLTAMLPRTQ